ncbi:hypothetical protein AVEN_110026-1 [Araneus ventricosus]|uniref:Uncharacterized protein n=1 Tax=Araneus ventricosus TaxID=182803 RepID=A0A4Y2H483_ARAVE|nr:hypothetical protein AVEN_110026-1 [Araneus ventricosus]
MKKEMKKGQEEMKKELEIGQEEMKNLIRAEKEEMRAHVENQVEEMKEHVNRSIRKVEKDVRGVETEIDEFQEKISVLDLRIRDLEIIDQIISRQVQSSCILDRWSNH